MTSRVLGVRRFVEPAPRPPACAVALQIYSTERRRVRSLPVDKKAPRAASTAGEQTTKELPHGGSKQYR